MGIFAGAGVDIVAEARVGEFTAAGIVAVAGVGVVARARIGLVVGAGLVAVAGAEVVVAEAGIGVFAGA